MNLIKLLITFLIISCLMGCGCEKLRLTEKEKEWVSHFKMGQSQYYSNSKREIDTLEVIDSAIQFSPCNKFELSNFQYESFTVRFKFRSKLLYNGDESFITISTVEREKRIPHIYIGNLGPHRNDLENELPKKIDTTIGDKMFNSIYVYTKNINAEQYDQQEYFKSFFWSKEEGLVAYLTVDNNLFLLISK